MQYDQTLEGPVVTDVPHTGWATTQLYGQTFRARWRVIGDHVEIRSELGVESAPLGPLRTAPGTVAREKLAEMARRASRHTGAKPAASKPSLRKIMRWRP